MTTGTATGGAGRVAGRARRGRAFGKLLQTEGKLAWRTPFGLGLGVVIPAFFLFIIGSVPAMRQPGPGTLTQFGAFIPVLIGMSLALIALIALPIPLVLNRDRGVLRRFATTPVAPSWLLAAQVVVNLALALMAIVIIVAGGALFFGVRLPSQPAGFVLSVLLAIAAMFAIGLLIAALCPSAAVAGAVGTVVLYPLLFFSGLWTPTADMSPFLRRLSGFTPLNAAVQAMRDAMQGTFPPARPLLVLAACAVICGALAVRYFRWE